MPEQTMQMTPQQISDALRGIYQILGSVTIYGDDCEQFAQVRSGLRELANAVKLLEVAKKEEPVW